jgi:separase
MRIWNAAIDVTRRLDPKHPPKHVEKNPFDMDDLISALPETQPPRVLKADIKARLVQRPGPEGWHLVLARELLEAQSRMSEHCLNKGSPRDAEYFILQCRTLSEALGAPIHLLRSICLQTYLQIRLWHTDNSCNHLKEAKMLAKDVSSSFLRLFLGSQPPLEWTVTYCRSIEIGGSIQ